MIWVIGNKGMLGRELCRQIEAAGLPLVGTDREVSILEPQSLVSFFKRQKKIEWIVNCSAYTAVDKAENDADAAFAVNRDGPANIARLASEHGIPLIHISTDYVFDGTSSTILDEEAPVGPNGVYGKSKLAGEEEIRRIWGKHIIIRTSWLYGLYGPNFVYTMLRLMNTKDALKVVNDQTGSPTNAADLAAFILHLLQSRTQYWGTFHYSNEGSTSWYDFALEIYRLGREKGLVKQECLINPCPSTEYPTPAKRPAYSLMSKEKVKRVYGVSVPEWSESLNSFVDRLTQVESSVSNWLEHADYDFVTAKVMHEHGRYLYVAITCQQSIEKNIKAVFELYEITIPRIHDLVRLYQYLFGNTGKYDQLLKDLTYYYIASRYSERISRLSSELNTMRSEYILKNTEELNKWLQLKLPYAIQ